MTDVSKKLEDLGFAYGTDKSKIEHDFLDLYQEQLHRFLNKSFVMLEIGVCWGQSLRMWGDWFSLANIVGIDINKDCANMGNGRNTHVRIGDASSRAVLDTIVREFGAPSIVIDDGSHLWLDQIATLQIAWPHIVPGGCFIMEDMHTSFPGLAQNYGCGGHISTYAYIEKLNRWVIGNRFMADEQPYDLFVKETWPTVHSILSYRGTCIIRKKV